MVHCNFQMLNKCCVHNCTSLVQLFEWRHSILYPRYVNQPLKTGISVQLYSLTLPEATQDLCGKVVVNAVSQFQHARVRNPLRAARICFTLSSVPYCSESGVKRLYVQLPSKSSWGCLLGLLGNMHCKQKLARWGSRGSTVARAIGCPADARVFESPARRELENRNSVLGCRIDPT